MGEGPLQYGGLLLGGETIFILFDEDDERVLMGRLLD